MADRALTREAMLNGLHDIRLPAEAPGGLIAELLAVIGVALIIAVLVGLIMRSVTLPGKKPAKQSPQDRLAALAKLPDSDRQIALLHLLKSERPDAFRKLSPQLYAPGGAPDIRVLEAEVAGHD
ncbi:hypothetical protein [Sedimentitalea todarodis]|uniref:Uncharacterized protein n=1 Tax=Sedimentitalea todarodis TaxID=1631240 RepID=A0ABU3VJ83_9RHOB|nr:hypothetical protein [Sedimentitalea todarodis]MDU9005774.1 hypothetical protein [Sedimentitalea todarodis]